jgi:restriction system protein
MAVPGFQTLMRPLLNMASDGYEHTRDEASEKLAQQYTLSDEERKHVLTSGQTRFSHRLGRTILWLTKARLLQSLGKERFA